jgi:CheY-like chemotaxis protein
MKDDFLATLSHELRNPLAAILGWVAVARVTKGKPDELANALDTIERNAHVQTRLVDDLLDITRLQAGSLHIEFTPLPLDAPVRAAIETVRPSAAAKSIAIHYVCDAPPWVNGDAQRLQQVASNLLVNAVKFTPQGGTISLHVSQEGGSAVLTVRDTGEGIDPDFLPRLFTRFKQADTGTARRHGGLGLGLSIVDNLVRLHGGTVTAHSDGRGKGATLTVRLPITKPREAGAAQPQRIAPAQSTLQGVRVLLVDDDPDIRRAVVELLKNVGAEVVAVESGEQIEHQLTQQRPDVLLMDIGMPGEDGYSLIQRIRRLAAAQGGNTPAISLTAHAREEDRAKALSAGFQFHLAKPIDLPLLVATIQTSIADAKTPAIFRND